MPMRLRDPNNEVLPRVLLQYQFDVHEHRVNVTLPHGNARKTNNAYRRTQESTKIFMKDSLKMQPKKALDLAYQSVGDIQDARSVGELPRNRQDMYNARRVAKAESLRGICGTKNEEWKDDLWKVLQLGRDEGTAKLVRDCRLINGDFFAVLSTEKQLKDIEIFCCNSTDPCVLEFDPTFNIFHENLSLTVSTYRNKKLLNRTTGKHPVFIGPLLLHQDKSWKTYSTFSHVLVTENDKLCKLVAYGTDGEKALIDGLRRNFQDSVSLRCFIHVRKNIETELSKRGLQGQMKQRILKDIFGYQEGETKFLGLVDSKTEEEFDEKLMGLKDDWEIYEQNNSGNSFHHWFTIHQGNCFRKSMIIPPRQKAGLGDPPIDYTNNDVEAANFMVKYALEFEKSNPGRFIMDISNLIEQQFRDEDRAIVDKGPYCLSTGFKAFGEKDDKWITFNQATKQRKLSRFHAATIEEAYSSNATKEVEALLCISDFGSSSSIPNQILLHMIDRANNILRSNSIVTAPTTTNTFIVGVNGSTFKVTCGKSNSFTCEKNCKNFKMKICEHTMSVAYHTGRYKQFLKWFLKCKQPSFTDFVVSGGKKGCGRKPSRRKRTNEKKADIVERIDMFQTKKSDDVENSKFLQPVSNISQNNVNSGVQSVATLDVPKCDGTNANNIFTTSSIKNNPVSSKIFTNTQSFCNTRVNANLPSIYTQSNQNSVITNPLRSNTNALQQLYPESNIFNQSTNIFANSISAPIPSSQSAFCHQFLAPTALISGQNTPTVFPLPRVINMPSLHPRILSQFSVKLVAGTSVRRCYGCKGDIINPPQTYLEQICIVNRDYRLYKDPLTGLLTKTKAKQNNHFHPFKTCIFHQYESFDPSTLIIPREYYPVLGPEIVTFLNNEFGLTIHV